MFRMSNQLRKKTRNYFQNWGDFKRPSVLIIQDTITAFKTVFFSLSLQSLFCKKSFSKLILIYVVGLPFPGCWKKGFVLRLLQTILCSKNKRNYISHFTKVLKCHFNKANSKFLWTLKFRSQAVGKWASSLLTLKEFVLENKRNYICHFTKVSFQQ